MKRHIWKDGNTWAIGARDRSIIIISRPELSELISAYRFWFSMDPLSRRKKAA